MPWRGLGLKINHLLSILCQWAFNRMQLGKLWRGNAGKLEWRQTGPETSVRIINESIICHTCARPAGLGVWGGWGGWICSRFGFPTGPWPSVITTAPVSLSDDSYPICHCWMSVRMKNKNTCLKSDSKYIEENEKNNIQFHCFTVNPTLELQQECSCLSFAATFCRIRAVTTLACHVRGPKHTCNCTSTVRQVILTVYPLCVIHHAGCMPGRCQEDFGSSERRWGRILVMNMVATDSCLQLVSGFPPFPSPHIHWGKLLASEDKLYICGISQVVTEEKDGEKHKWWMAKWKRTSKCVSNKWQNKKKLYLKDCKAHWDIWGH